MNVSTKAISVVLVDDHTLFREGLAELLASDTVFHVVGQGSDGTDALTLVDQHHPDVVLVDIEMPGPGARETVSRLRQAHPDTHVIVLTMHDKPELVWELLERGAAGTAAQIGRQLTITEGTVKRHLTNIYAKLGAVSRVDAIRKATAAHLILGIDS